MGNGQNIPTSRKWNKFVFVSEATQIDWKLSTTADELQVQNTLALIERFEHLPKQILLFGTQTLRKLKQKDSLPYL